MKLNYFLPLYLITSHLTAMTPTKIITADKQTVHPTQALMGHSWLLHQAHQQRKEAVTVTAQASSITLLTQLAAAFDRVYDTKLLHDFAGINLFAMSNIHTKSEQLDALKTAQKLETAKLVQHCARLLRNLHPINPQPPVVAASCNNFMVEGAPIRSLQFIRNKNILVLTQDGQARIFSPRGALLATTGKHSLFLTDDDLQQLESTPATQELLDYCSKYRRISFNKECTVLAIHHDRNYKQKPQRTSITVHTTKDALLRCISEIFPEKGYSIQAHALNDNGDRLVTIERADRCLDTIKLKIWDTLTGRLLNQPVPLKSDRVTFPVYLQLFVHFDKSSDDVVYITTENFNTVERTREIYKGTFYSAVYTITTEEFKVQSTQSDLKFFNDPRTIVVKDYMPNQHNAEVTFKTSDKKDEKIVEQTITGFPQTVSQTARYKDKIAYAAGNRVYLQ